MVEHALRARPTARRASEHRTAEVFFFFRHTQNTTRARKMLRAATPHARIARAQRNRQTYLRPPLHVNAKRASELFCCACFCELDLLFACCCCAWLLAGAFAFVELPRCWLIEVNARLHTGGHARQEARPNERERGKKKLSALARAHSSFADGSISRRASRT